MRAMLVLAWLVALAGAAEAQSSQFGVRGLGLPGRNLSTRARSTGGSFGLFDSESSLTPTSLAGLGGMTAGFNITPEWRRWESPTGSASLQDTRFPLLLIGGPLPHRSVWLGISFSSYVDRDYRLASVDTVTIRSVPVGVTDTLSSTGGLDDLRFATAFRPSEGWTLGAAFHVITGSNRLESRRVFADTLFLPIRQTSELSYAGVGFSLGAARRVSSKLTLAALIRSDGHANVDRDSTRISRIDLPYSFAAGLLFRPTPKLQVAGQLLYRTWSGANSDLVSQGGIGAVNTIDLSAGIELIPDSRRPNRRPIRLGLRYADLPFPLATGQKAHEFSLSVGTGTRFAKGRAGVDLAVERAWRSDGSTQKERAFLFTAGISVRP